MNILGIIPARFGSTRFPGKSLVNIHGKPMVQRVFEQAEKCALLDKVVVATDDQRIYNCVKAFGEVVMTSSSHQSGTDRCAEAITKVSGTFDFIINIQGDEPFIQPEQISTLASVLNKQTELATLVKKITNKDTLFNPNTPKVVLNTASEAIYFSRSTIPFMRCESQTSWLSSHAFYKHIGIYAYRQDILETITRLPPSSLEQAESLEQLRWIENGFKIKVAITELESYGIDTPEDLEKILGMEVNNFPSSE